MELKRVGLEDRGGEYEMRFLFTAEDGSQYGYGFTIRKGDIREGVANDLHSAAVGIENLGRTVNKK